MKPQENPVREVVAEDLSAIWELLLEREPGTPAWTKADLEKEIVASQSFAERGAKLTAFVFFRSAVDAYEIIFLGTLTPYRRSGAMRRLLTRLQLFARNQQRPLWLEVHESNIAAQNLYLNLGFEEVGRRPRYYADGGGAILYNYG